MGPIKLPCAVPRKGPNVKRYVTGTVDLAIHENTFMRLQDQFDPARRIVFAQISEELNWNLPMFYEKKS